MKWTTKEAYDIFKGFNYSLYWLKVLINLKYINEAEAGYLITLNKGVKMRNKKIEYIINQIKRYEIDVSSPNEVNKFAWDIGIKDLTSKEVVFISDNL